MRRRRAWAAALAIGGTLLGESTPALGQSHAMMMHHGVPSRVVANQRVGPYVASLWIEPEVGDGATYVILRAADGLPFTPPPMVRVAAAPASGRTAEMVEEAHLESVRAGAEARYMTHLMFDRAERWTVRVIVEGAAGGGQLVTPVEATTNASMGLFGVSLASAPFLLVGFVYWRGSVARRRVRLPPISPDA